jgi:MoaA/NifB/PqqE/SkfB family radical SAM enzyme
MSQRGATALFRRLTRIRRRWREAQMFARTMAHADHPILAQIVPVRRCNLSCSYCNEYDKTSAPVPTEAMLGRIDKLSALGTGIITFSGGEPTLHPDLDVLIRRVRANGGIATLITNGYLLTVDRIQRFNAAGLDYLQISIDNVDPDDISKKSLRVLDRKLEWLSQHADFDVTINSVLGADIARPNDAVQIATRARGLGFNSTVGILHDGSGQLRPIDREQQSVYEKITALGGGLFTFSHFDAFQRNIIKGQANRWHCRAGGRFLYICEDGFVHYCSQQRGRPGIPLDQYTRVDVMREAQTPKLCAPFCTVSCVHQTAMLDEFRDHPRETLIGIIERRQERDPGWEPPVSIRLLQWMFLGDPRRRDRIGAVALRLLRAGARFPRPGV